MVSKGQHVATPVEEMQQVPDAQQVWLADPIQHVFGEAQQVPLHPTDPDGQQTPFVQVVPAAQHVGTPVEEMQQVPDGQQVLVVEPIQQAFGAWQQVVAHTAVLGQHALFRQTEPAAQQIPLHPTVPVAQQTPFEQAVPAGQHEGTPVEEMQQVPDGQQVLVVEPTQQAFGDWQQVPLQFAVEGQHAPFRQIEPAGQQTPLQLTVPVVQQTPFEQVVPAGQHVGTPAEEMQHVPVAQQVLVVEPTQQAFGDWQQVPLQIAVVGQHAPFTQVELAPQQVATPVLETQHVVPDAQHAVVELPEHTVVPPGHGHSGVVPHVPEGLH